MVDVFNNTNLCTSHSKRKNIMAKDLVLAVASEGSERLEPRGH
jgi:histone H3/H4